MPPSGALHWKKSLLHFSACQRGTQVLLWLRTLLSATGFPQLTATPLLCDNRSAVVLTEDPVFHSRMRHVHTRYLHIRHHVRLARVKLHDVHSSFNIAAIFIKALPRPAFFNLRLRLGLSDSSCAEEPL